MGDGIYRVMSSIANIAKTLQVCVRILFLNIYQEKQRRQKFSAAVHLLAVVQRVLCRYGSGVGIWRSGWRRGSHRI